MSESSPHTSVTAALVEKKPEDKARLIAEDLLATEIDYVKKLALIESVNMIEYKYIDQHKKILE